MPNQLDRIGADLRRIGESKLDQPLAFIAALRMLLENWIRAEGE